MEADAGRYLGYVRVVGRRQAEAKLAIEEGLVNVNGVAASRATTHDWSPSSGGSTASIEGGRIRYAPNDRTSAAFRKSLGKSVGCVGVALLVDAHGAVP